MTQARQFQTARDLKAALAWALEQPPPAVKPSPVRTGWVRIVAIASIGALLAGGGWWFGRRGAPHGIPYWTVRQLTSDQGYTAGGALSPDGKLVAYTSDRAGAGTQDLWIQQTAVGPPVRLTSGPFSAYDPGFSPDGSKVVFRSSERPQGIYIIPTLGGEPRRLADAPGEFTPRFSLDGHWISTELAIGAGAGVGKVSFLLIPSAGGEPVLLDPKLGITTAGTIVSSNDNAI